MEMVTRAVPGIQPSYAATGGVFIARPGFAMPGLPLALNAPGENRMNGKPFRVTANGSLLFNFAGSTYTATAQPILYGTRPGGSATSSTAIFSPAATSVTVNAANLVTGETSMFAIPWQIEASMSGDKASGTLFGTVLGYVGTPQLTAVSLINAPTGIDFKEEPPLQFFLGVTFTNNPFVVTRNGYASGATLSQFALEM